LIWLDDSCKAALELAPDVLAEAQAEAAGLDEKIKEFNK